MASERLTWGEICKKYPNQWVGLIDVIYEDNATYGNIESAIVKVFNGSKEDLERRQLIDHELDARHTDPNRLERGLFLCNNFIQVVWV